MRSPAKIAKVVLAVIVCSMLFLEFWTYSELHTRDPLAWTDVLKGTADAPAQYRVGVIFLADFIARHGHRKLHQSLVLIDLFASLTTVCSTYILFFRSKIYRAAGETQQWLGAAAFCLLTVGYLAWLTWYIRPETLTNAAVISLTLLLLTVRIPLSPPLDKLIAVAGMLLLAAISGLVRADMAATLHAGVFLICLLTPWSGMALPRFLQAGASALCGIIAGGIQYYMMHVRYPYSTYGNTPVFQLLGNIRDVSSFVPFLLALFPFWWLTVSIFRRRIRLNYANQGVYLGSLIFLVIWSIFGRIQEVRIFLPYGLALIPLTTLAAMKLLTGGEDTGNAEAL